MKTHKILFVCLGNICRSPMAEYVLRQTDLIPDSGYNHVPDPWYTGNFDETYRLVDAGSLALLEKLKQA